MKNHPKIVKNEKKYISLNGDMLNRIKGKGTDDDYTIEHNPSFPTFGSTDNLCGSCPYHRNG